MTATHDAHRLAPPQFARLPRVQVPLYIYRKMRSLDSPVATLDA